MNVTTDFDSGGSVDLTVDEEEQHIEMDYDDPYYGHDFVGHFRFRLEDAAGEEWSFEMLNLEDNRMPEDYHMVYSYSLDTDDFGRFDESVEGGFSFTPEEDEVYISNFHSYSYQRSVDRVEDLDGQDFVETEVIGQSEEERDQHVIRIKDESTDTDDALHIFALTRSHAGETQGSWHMDAAIDWVLDNLRGDAFGEDYVFHFIPNANPDGMYHSLHRHDTDGNDFNREWDSETPVEIENMKDYIRENVGTPRFGFDHHSSTRPNFDAVWSHEPAIEENDHDHLLPPIESASISLDGVRYTDNLNRSRGFFYEETGGSMVSTEVWTYYEYETEQFETEGIDFYEVVTSTVSEGESAIATVNGQIVTVGGNIAVTDKS